MTDTVFMKLTGAIVVGGHVVGPPAIVEVSAAEAANLARRGKAVAATEGDTPTVLAATREPEPAAEPERDDPPAPRKSRKS